jgi:ABC-2 type transport system ATP-binding protein
MLKAEKLSKTYEDGTKALENLDLQINEGEIYCLLGANGAGKTTTINLFLNFLHPTSGIVLINGIDVVKNPLDSKKFVSYVPEQVMLYGNLRATHNLEFFSNLGGRRGLGRNDYYSILKKVGLEEKVFEKKVKYFSKGMRQKVALAIAIIKGAPNMLLDEPTAGLDPKAAHEFTRILMDLRDEGKAILVSTHDIFRAKQIANRIGIMKHGILVAEMEPQAIVNDNIEGLYLDLIDNREVTMGEKNYNVSVSV